MCEEKLRLLELAVLGSAIKTDVPYKFLPASSISYITRQIADTLCVKDEEVESWVIRGVSAKVIQAKLDQVSQTARIKYTKLMHNHCLPLKATHLPLI